MHVCLTNQWTIVISYAFEAEKIALLVSLALHLKHS